MISVLAEVCRLYCHELVGNGHQEQIPSLLSHKQQAIIHLAHKSCSVQHNLGQLVKMMVNYFGVMPSISLVFTPIAQKSRMLARQELRKVLR